MKFFITLEGIEGAGKSTLQSLLASDLRAKGHEIVLTREPGATRLGQTLRSLLLDCREVKLTPMAEVMLFSADRAQHVAEVIGPALSSGKIVLCDRYLHSTLAYQGYGHGVDMDSLEKVLLFAAQGLLPDLTFILDLDPRTGLHRANRRTAEPIDRFESLELEFHCRVREGFLEMAKQCPEKFVVLDASKKPEEIALEALSTVLKRLGG